MYGSNIGNPDVEVVGVVDVDTARLWLSRNHPNQRAVRKAHVSMLAEAMKSGAYRFTGDPIRFDSRGRLIDGQHRLLACIASGVPLKNVIVVRVFDDEAALYIDQHAAARHERDAAAFMGVKYPELRVAYAILNVEFGMGNHALKSVSKIDRVRAVINHPLTETIARLYREDRKNGSIANMALLIAAALVIKVSPRDGETFFMNVMRNDHVGASADYTRMIFNYFVGQKTRNDRGNKMGRYPTEQKMLDVDRTIRCWNAYRMGREHTRMHSGKSLPKVVP